jgi:hypothetical protein
MKPHQTGEPGANRHARKPTHDRRKAGSAQGQIQAAHKPAQTQLKRKGPPPPARLPQAAKRPSGAAASRTHNANSCQLAVIGVAA